MKHQLNAENALRIDQLYSAGASLLKRAANYRAVRDHARAARAIDAANRLNLRAYMLLLHCLSHTEHTRMMAKIAPR